jgi:hypothetical protein
VATVVKRRGKWTLDYRDQHGKRRWEATDGNRKQAELLLAERLQEIGRGEFQAKADRTTFAQLAEAFIAGHVKLNVRDTTRRDCEGNIRRHLQPHFGNRVIRTITPEAIERFRTDLHQRVGLRTANKCLTLLSMMFGYAAAPSLVSSNPATMVRKLRPARARPGERQHPGAGRDRQAARGGRRSLATHHQDGHFEWVARGRVARLEMDGHRLDKWHAIGAPHVLDWPVQRTEKQGLA